MCGIVGLHGRQEDGWIEDMNAVQHHRGPDGGGVFRDRDAGLALAMRRLAIIDLADGDQPMISPDGRYVLVYNGEIFNAVELRREMEAAGEVFVTDHSDTEVLLRLLMRRGKAALPRLNGMFAFAFYDRAERVLLCARDRMGIKPFHYVRQGGRFAFASEIKSLLRLPILERRVDRQSLFDYLSLMYTPGERTMLDGVSRLLPGHSLTYRLVDGVQSVERWWTPAFRPDHRVPAREWPERIRTALSAAVGRWSRSDVPVACSLSGGLDSAAVVGFLAQSGAKVRTVSLGFAGAGEEDWDELSLARLVARKWDTDHQEVRLDPQGLLDDLGAMVRHLDEPYGGGLPSWSVFKVMGAQVRVGFTGLGGDELFGNYGKWIRLEGRLLPRLYPGLGRRHVGFDTFRREFFDRCYYLPDEDKRGLSTDGGAGLRDTAALLYERYAAATGEGPRDRMAATDMHTQLPDEFLLMTDRFSMAHSLEARTPFLDNELVDLVLTIPAALRTRRGDLKGLLRRAVAPVLPPELLTAPKRGFGVPMRLWLRGRLRPFVERLLAPSALAAGGLLKPDVYDACVRPHLDGRTDRPNLVWGLLMFQLWHHAVIEGAGPGDMDGA
ncbi:MAG TPA: asparagine synthase (glutamine-hydrolyzing) [Azospirillum sp.]